MPPHLILWLLSPFGAFSMLPLHIHQLHLIVTKNLSLPIQNYNGSLNILQVLIHLNVVQRDKYSLGSDTLPKLGHMEGVIDPTQLIRKVQSISKLANSGINLERTNKSWS